MNYVFLKKILYIIRPCYDDDDDDDRFEGVGEFHGATKYIE